MSTLRLRQKVKQNEIAPFYRQFNVTSDLITRFD